MVERCERVRAASNTDLIYDGRVSLAQIRYFVAVAEEGNVSTAAAKLRVAQPPVSRQIRALEDELGTPLFRRTPRGMALLPSGEAFLGHARKILNAVDEAALAARSAGQSSAED
jgi:DNA-binding transcriptional LysR family regulator